MRSILFLAAIALGAPAWADVDVTTRSGPVRGSESSGVAVFKGIPYAAAPVGALRWRMPQPAPTWAAPRDAIAFGAACPQPRREDRQTELAVTAEDCLFLNVWTRDVHAAAPVMVWIHGGAFRIGSGSVPISDGTEFAKDGVVLVTLNYRLGRLGFFAHPALGDEVGNYGLADQIAALEWVRDNIAAFGGDPSRVTIFGESAGGSSVIYLLTSPRASGLFRTAIVESGGGFQYDRSLHEGRGARPSLIDEGTAWARAQNIADGDANALRALPVDSVIGARLDGGLAAVAPVTDGTIVTGDPGVLLAKGQFNRVPVLIGANSFEASVLGAFGQNAATLIANAGIDMARVTAVYGDVKGDALADALFGDATFVAPSRHVARSVAAAGEPAYLYYFDYVLARRRGAVPGAGHGSEILFAFDNLARLPLASAFVTGEDQVVAEKLHRYWVNFAKTGDPNGKGLPAWPAVHGDDVSTLVIRTKIEAARDFRAPQLDLHQQRWRTSEGL